MSTRISTLAKAVKEHPEDSFYKFTLALEMLKIDQSSKARVLFEAIRENDPEWGFTLQNYIWKRVRTKKL